MRPRRRSPVDHDREEEFLLDHQEILADFVQNDEDELHIPPMNSFFRRLLHQLAKQFHLDTRSIGEGKDRHIVLTKTEKTIIPEKIKPKPVRQWDYGDKEFLVDPMQQEVDVVLTKDGTFGVYGTIEGTILDRKKVTSGSFKIRGNKIVEIQDDEW